MSTGPFTRTNRNTPQRNLNKSQEPTQASNTPSQVTVVQQEESNKGGYVYKPPTRIARTNLNTVKVQEKVQVKKQEPQKPVETSKIQQPPVPKPASFVRKPVTQIIKQTTVKTTVITTTEVTEIKEELKPTTVKSVSRLPLTRTNESSSVSVLKTPRKQVVEESTKVQGVSKPITSPYTRSKPSPIEIKTDIKLSEPTSPKNPLQEFANDPTKTIPILQIKKPSPFYTYPKRISKRDSQKFEQTQVESKTQEVEEAKVPTPKFSEQQNNQAPQMFSSTYSYKGKNSASQVSVQSSQSSTNVRNPYKSAVVYAPVAEKVVEPQKSADAPIARSTSKTPLSHASRYSNKVVETPVQTKTEKEQTVVVSDQNIAKEPVKRSLLIVFVLHRLYTQKVVSHFNQFVQYSKNEKETKGNERIHQYFERSLSKFIKTYEQNALLRATFGLLKSIYSKMVKTDLKKSTDSKVSHQLTANRNQAFCRVLESIVKSELSELRFSFIKLKSNLNENKGKQIKRNLGVKILSGIEVRKMKELFSDLKDWTLTKYQLKLLKLGKCSQVNLSYKKWLLIESWSKLVSCKLKEYSSEIKSSQAAKSLVSKPSISNNKPAEKPAVQSTEQVPQTNVQLKQKITEMELKLKEIQQRTADIPKESDLRRSIQELKEQKSQISQEIANKKQRSSELKQRLQTLLAKVSHESLSSLSEERKDQQEPTLHLLHEVYMKIYKQSEQECTSQQNISSLCNIHRVEQNSNKEIISKWLAIGQNLTLKHWINLYEGNYIEEAGDQGIIAQRKQANKQIQEENELVKKFIRSYIKERYMWEEVKEYVAAVISE